MKPFVLRHFTNSLDPAA